MNRRITQVARALGANRVVRLGRVEHTPFGLLSLTDGVRRLRSTGPRGTGRPSDPESTVPRIVKFKPLVWKQLAVVARQQGRMTGRRVSPAQVASILIEGALRGSRQGRRRAGHG